MFSPLRSLGQRVNIQNFRNQSTKEFSPTETKTNAVGTNNIKTNQLSSSSFQKGFHLSKWDLSEEKIRNIALCRFSSTEQAIILQEELKPLFESRFSNYKSLEYEYLKAIEQTLLQNAAPKVHFAEEAKESSKKTLPKDAPLKTYIPEPVPKEVESELKNHRYLAALLNGRSFHDSKFKIQRREGVPMHYEENVILKDVMKGKLSPRRFETLTLLLSNYTKRQCFTEEEETLFSKIIEEFEKSYK